MDHTEEFYRFYRDKMLALDAQPNMAHIKLAELEKAGKLKAICTRKRAVRMSWNCTAASTATSACTATNSSTPNT